MGAVARTESWDFAALHRAISIDLGFPWCKIAVLRTHSIKETCLMSLESHLAELERRHRALEDEISEALAHPSSDGLKIAELKRRKLQVKDEIRRLQNGQTVSVH